LPVSPLLNSPEVVKDTPVRHFSVFPLTSHMHTPTLRLVSLHSSLSVTLSFIRVPEIHETFTWKVFFARASTSEDVISTVMEELGLAKTLPIPGAGILEYVLEEVWEDGKSERKFHSLVFSLILISSQARHDSHPRLLSQRLWRQRRRNQPQIRLPIVSVYRMSGIGGAERGHNPQAP
jgi:hypothetical protein